LFIGLAVFGFFWGIVKILFNRENAIAKAEGRNYMLYGIILLFVMSSVWSLVYFLKNSFFPS
jgi:hypothetical protein